MEIYKKQRNNRGLPQENETNTTNGLRLSKLRKLQIEGLGSMRRLSLKSTLFGVDPKVGIRVVRVVCVFMCVRKFFVHINSFRMRVVYWRAVLPCGESADCNVRKL